MQVALLAEGVDRNLSVSGIFVTSLVALLAEGVDRNVIALVEVQHFGLSPSSRRAWIEIDECSRRTTRPRVALLAEGVDRNNHDTDKVVGKVVALLAEGVDRNWTKWTSFRARLRSPSSRRAWIEIWQVYKDCDMEYVALLAEGVDRNLHGLGHRRLDCVALLAEGVDRNWIRSPGAAPPECRPPRGGRG